MLESPNLEIFRRKGEEPNFPYSKIPQGINSTAEFTNYQQAMVDHTNLAYQPTDESSSRHRPERF